MLQIRLSKPATDASGISKSGPSESVTVACPDHLVLADLPVAKSLGTPFAIAKVKNVGRRSRRQLGERVHFCVQCDFPIAIYGRLSPCEHAFCLDCARSDSVCYLCDERIQKIQTIKMMEGLFICAAPRCLRSFLNKSEFEFHIKESHADLLQHGKERGGNELEVSSRKSSASDSAVQPPGRSVFSPTSNSQIHDYDEKALRSHGRDQQFSRSSVLPKQMQQFSAQLPNHPYEQHPDFNQYQGPDRAANFPQQSFGPTSGFQADSVNQGSSVPPTQYGYGQYSSDGTQKYYAEAGLGQSSLSSFPSGPPGHTINVAQNGSQPWSTGPPLASQGISTGFMNVDHQGRGFPPGDYAQNMGNLPAYAAPPPHLAQSLRGRAYPSDNSHDGPPGFGWQSSGRRDGFGAGLD